jgi:hypothetical protein
MEAARHYHKQEESWEQGQHGNGTPIPAIPLWLPEQWLQMVAYQLVQQQPQLII